MELRDLQCSLRRKYLALRNLYRLVESNLFQQVFDSVSTEAKARAATIVESGDKKKLLEWLSSHNVDLDFMSIRALRKRAQKAGVRRYNHLTRNQLIAEITRAETVIDC
jgi:hypothetical protein